MAPPPIPVPIVKYNALSKPFAAPKYASPNAAPLTSVSNPIGKPG